MMLNLLSIVSSDKYLEHPLLGSISCSGTYEAFKRCHELLNSNGALPIQCRSLHEISTELHSIQLNKIGTMCYKKRTTEEVKQWLDEKIDERRRLYKVKVIFSRIYFLSVPQRGKIFVA